LYDSASAAAKARRFNLRKSRFEECRLYSDFHFCTFFKKLIPFFNLQASENVGYKSVAKASMEILGRAWNTLAPVLRTYEAASLVLAAAECCQASMQCGREVALSTAALCCPSVPHLVDLEHGEPRPAPPRPAFSNESSSR
jgi:hypothetical protein